MLRSILTSLAMIFLAMPLWARPNATHLDKATWSPDQKTEIGTKDFDPGNYQLEARESANQMDILKGGKLVAQVPCQWIQLSKKAGNDEVVTNKDSVVQVQFQGRTEAIQFR